MQPVMRTAENPARIAMSREIPAKSVSLSSRFLSASTFLQQERNPIVRMFPLKSFRPPPIQSYGETLSGAKDVVLA